VKRSFRLRPARKGERRKQKKKKHLSASVTCSIAREGGKKIRFGRKKKGEGLLTSLGWGKGGVAKRLLPGRRERGGRRASPTNTSYPGGNEYTHAPPAVREKKRKKKK